MPEFPIVDSHVHLYDIARLSYSWLQNVPQINRSYGLADFDAARGPVDVETFVFAEVAVDAGLHLAEAEFVQELADADRRLGGSIAHAPLEKGVAVAADLDRLAALPSVRGIRRLIETECDPSFVLAPDFLAALRLLPRYGFSFDICGKHWAMAYAIELVRRCPDVSFVLDHIGKPDIRNGLRQPWWDQIRELAALPNVVCKVSGVITEADRTSWKPADVRPYVEHVIDCFGFDRVMYGSDWTVAELTHRYPDWVAILDDILAGASLPERRAFYRDTAIRTYRLDV